MKWADTILFDRPLRDVCLLTGAPGQDWQTFLREREQAAHENGRREGERALSEQLMHQRNETIEMQRGILESLQRTLPQIVREAETSMIEIALEVAKKIVADMPVDAAMVEATVREALRQVEDTAEIIIQLHPDDLALLRQHQSPILTGTPEAGQLRFTQSPDVSHGGCIVQTRFGMIDARRETKIEQLRQSLST